MCETIEREINGDSRAPALAREFVGSELLGSLQRSQWAQIIDDALLLVSELVTNAVRAGSSTVTVGVGMKPSEVTVSVSDRAGGWPVLKPRDAQARTGRGLLLVEALATAWGATAVVGGKYVWATLRAPASLTLI